MKTKAIIWSFGLLLVACNKTQHFENNNSRDLIDTIWIYDTIKIKTQSNINSIYYRNLLPDKVYKIVKKNVLSYDYKINPFYLRGDYNGDCIQDYWIYVKNKDNKKGIIIIDGKNYTFKIIGAGRIFGHGGDDFDWTDIWQIVPAKNVDDSIISQLKVDILHVIKVESASAYIYWDKGKFHWRQVDD
jgi:hypothetical protein